MHSDIAEVMSFRTHKRSNNCLNQTVKYSFKAVKTYKKAQDNHNRDKNIK